MYFFKFLVKKINIRRILLDSSCKMSYDKSLEELGAKNPENKSWTHFAGHPILWILV